MRAEVVAMDAEHLNMEAIQKAGKILKEGGLVAFPTETVYGLGGNALDSAASMKIYAAKGRPSDNPLIVHIADLKDLARITTEIPEGAQILAKKYWPGPLTMILKKSDCVPKSITGGLGTVAIRMPSHPVAAQLIRTSGVYIAAPSANISGKPSPTRGEHVIHDMKGRIDMIIVDDTVDIGVESTIVDLSEDVPTILRPGYITKEMLSEVLGEVRIDPAIMGSVKPGVVPKAPGMKYKHYAPKAKAVIFSGAPENVVAAICARYDEQTAKGERVAILGLDEHHYGGRTFISLGSEKRPQEAAARLFAALRELDERGDTVALCEAVDTSGIGLAVMNRMGRAAAFDIETV